MKPKILVVDIDGCLADNTHRLYPHNAVSYEDSFSRVSEDTVLNYFMMRNFLMDNYVKFLTWRSEVCRINTLNWLRKEFPFIEIDELIMRPLWDKRPSVDFKEEETKKLMEDYDIVLAIDDDIKIIEMYRRLGLNTLHINND